jgi:electron transfer flavoprotein beta subunit
LDHQVFDQDEDEAMKILACVKQVPEPETDVRVDDRGRWAHLRHHPTLQMNRYDACAVELAVRCKEIDPETEVDVVTVGPESSEAVLRRAMGMGADNGIHVQIDSEGYRSPFSTAVWIAGVATRKRYDLILSGVMSEDLMQGLVGPLTAGHLDVPCITSVTELIRVDSPAEITVERELESGYRERLAVTLPAVLTIQSGVYLPRYPVLSKLLNANRREIQKFTPGDFPPAPPRLICRSTELPQKTRAGRVLAGSTADKARHLYDIFREKAFLTR